MGSKPNLSRWLPAPIPCASLYLHLAALLGFVDNPARLQGLLAVLLANHAILACGMHPRSALLGPNTSRLPQTAANSAAVALTFDDGPCPVTTPRVLDLLDAHDAKASFFVIGSRAVQHAVVLREIVRRGHSIENHTHRHPLSFACWPPGAMWREIMTAQQAISDTCGQAPRFFRAPAGLRNPLLDPVLDATGLSLVSWSRRGYDTVCARPRVVTRRLTRRLSAGDILALHDGGSAGMADGRAVVLAVLPALLDTLAAANLKGVSLPQTARPALADGAAVPAAA